MYALEILTALTSRIASSWQDNVSLSIHLDDDSWWFLITWVLWQRRTLALTCARNDLRTWLKEIPWPGFLGPTYEWRALFRIVWVKKTCCECFRVPGVLSAWHLRGISHKWTAVLFRYTERQIVDGLVAFDPPVWHRANGIMKLMPFSVPVWHRSSEKSFKPIPHLRSKLAEQYFVCHRGKKTQFRA